MASAKRRLSLKIESHKPIVKKVNNTKNINVSPTINVTVNAVQGNVNANHLGKTIGTHIETAVKKSNHNRNSYEDQE